MMMISRKIILS